MRITIEDLESLKELSDELEENHTETEKQLHEDLGKKFWFPLGRCTVLTVTSETKEAQIREHVQKIDSLEDACQDLDNTIGQFRELVMQLQKYVKLAARITAACSCIFQRAW